MICLSDGEPPMPYADTRPAYKADCGPTVPGSKRPSSWSDISNLNPCAINACCSKWGHCGLTGEFCDKEKSDTGNPGTTGCISNCDLELKNNREKPAFFFKEGYFEGWNGNRPCLTMDVTQINVATDRFSHIHFAFAGLTNDFRVDLETRRSSLASLKL
jgi:hypothetical protein